MRVTVANGSTAALSAWRIEFDLPGLDASAVDLAVEGNVLRVTAERPPMSCAASRSRYSPLRGVRATSFSSQVSCSACSPSR